jgi:polyisoprenoid-binding protein YceI
MLRAVVGTGTILLVMAMSLMHAVAETWVPVREESRIGFRAIQMGAPFEGEFTSYRASIVFDPDRLDQSRVSFTVDIGSVDTRNAERDAAMQTADWFDASTHPTATFATDAITALGGSRYEARGTLTMRGVMRPVVFPFTLHLIGPEKGGAQQDGGQLARVEGEFPVARTEFGIGQGQWASEGVIGDQVLIQVDLTAKANGEPGQSRD